jgi:Domain of unknown function (DUF4411)
VKLSPQKTYFLDTSAFVTMHRYYPNKLLPDLWMYLEDMLKSRFIRSHEFVYDEIVPQTGEKDDLAKLISKYKSNFSPISKRQAQLVPEILHIYPRLIDPMSKKNEADPWIVAMVVEAMEGLNLFGKASDYLLVSMESEKSPNKIPAVCKRYDVRHMNLFEFFEDNGWKFGLSRK